MVVTFFPTARETGVTQERTASPSSCTVQAPHSAIPQPYFVPVRPRFSRRTHSSGMAGSTSSEDRLPLTTRVSMAYPRAEDTAFMPECKPGWANYWGSKAHFRPAYRRAGTRDKQLPAGIDLVRIAQYCAYGGSRSAGRGQSLSARGLSCDDERAWIPGAGANR